MGVEKMLKKMPGLDKSKEESRSITTIQGRRGKEKTPNSNGAQGNTSYPPTANSAQYGASQNAAWQQHGSRYSGYPGSAGQGNYGQCLPRLPTIILLNVTKTGFC